MVQYLAFGTPAPIEVPSGDVHLDGIGWIISGIVLCFIAALIFYFGRESYDGMSAPYWISLAVAVVLALIFLIRGVDQLLSSIAAWAAAGGGVALVIAALLILWVWTSSND